MGIALLHYAKDFLNVVSYGRKASVFFIEVSEFYTNDQLVLSMQDVLLC